MRSSSSARRFTAPARTGAGRYAGASSSATASAGSNRAENQWLAILPYLACDFPPELRRARWICPQHRPNLGNFEGQCLRSPERISPRAARGDRRITSRPRPRSSLTMSRRSGWRWARPRAMSPGAHDGTGLYRPEGPPDDRCLSARARGSIPGRSRDRSMQAPRRCAMRFTASSGERIVDSWHQEGFASRCWRRPTWRSSTRGAACSSRSPSRAEPARRICGRV